MRVAVVDLGKRSYNIHIHHGAIEHVGQYVAEQGLKGRSLVVTNEVIGQIYAQAVEESLAEEGFEVKTIEVEDSEKAKSLCVVEQLYQEAYNFGLDRSSPVIALGGGVVGDLTGYVAATYMRGVPFFQVPTSLLAQVDSSVGGKVAVNYLVKNLIGSFYQPWSVIIDPGTLDSLPAREFRSGMGEVIKYGVIWDAELFETLEENASRIRNLEPALLEDIIFRSCAIKAEIVAKDELDYGLRSILNLGHTFGHALEVAGGFGGVKHGEAVAIGICMASKLSEMLGLISTNDRLRIKSLVEKYGLPCCFPPQVRPDYLLEVMTRDKKNKMGRIAIILPTAIGRVERMDFKLEELEKLFGELVL